MPVMSCQPGTLVVWGAGATATLGMRTTERQGRFLQALAGEPNDRSRVSLDLRVTNALDNPADGWVGPFSDLLTILGDGSGNNGTTRVTSQQFDAMRRNWSAGADGDAIRDRILGLRSLYDWVTLRSVIDVVRDDSGSGAQGGSFLNDLFNILDMHGQSGHGFRAGVDGFLTPGRISGARNALIMLLLAVFYVDWQRLLGDRKKRRELRLHCDLAVKFGKRMQKEGVERAGIHDPERPEFYLGDVGFVSFNYDPVALWLQYIANRELNLSPSVPHIGNPVRRLQIYHDLGHSVPSVRISGKNPGSLRFSMNESAAQRLNDPDHGATDRIRVSKFLFPHGCLAWRECPSCGKLSSYLGDRWEADSPTLFLPPPLKAFVSCRPKSLHKAEEREKFEKGAVDVRACVHCDELTEAHHTRVIMQSNFKTPPPPFLEEIQRELRVLVEGARHIVFMGYSLPRDDVTYRAFFAARRRRGPQNPLKCSVVVGSDERYRGWLGPRDLSKVCDLGLKEDVQRAVEGAQGLFGRENVRFYGGGIPQVFLDGANVTDSAVERLIGWDSCG